MMYRYMALEWDRRDMSAAQVPAVIAAALERVSPHAWTTSHVAPGLQVMDAGAASGRMRTTSVGTRGVILGQLFPRLSSAAVPQVSELDDNEAERCWVSGAQHLVDAYWGRYVAILHDPSGDRCLILRDPTGALPCFVTHHAGVDIYFSDMEDAARLPFLPFSINWDFVRANIMLPMYQKIITGLNEVSEVLPAECLEIASGVRSRRFLWDPYAIAASGIIEDPQAAARELRGVVRATIATLAGGYDRVIHNLGGLDSSIALACLTDAPARPEITAITHFTPTPRGDERAYTRAMARHADVPLIEAELDAARADVRRIFASNRLARPHGFFDCLGLNGHVLETADAVGAQAIFYGVGGDQVFFQPPLNMAALDHVKAHGFGRRSIAVALEASRYGRCRVADTLAAMWRERIRPEPCYPYVSAALFRRRRLPLVEEAVTEAAGYESLLHPLLRPADDMSKGKYLHILMSAFFSIEHYDHWDTAYTAERVHLFLAQPIIEACLRIPTWVLTYRGIDRGLARRAFAGDLPPVISARLSKNGPDDYYGDLYRRNVDAIRPVLVGGQLVREGILKAGAVERALGAADHSTDAHPPHLLGHFATEAWIERWRQRPSIIPL